MFYRKVLAQLQAYGVRYLVAGAVAMNLHGVPRMTADLDLLVDLSEENLRALLAALTVLGFHPRLPVPAEALLDPDRRREWVETRHLRAFTFVDPARPFFEVDVLLSSPIPFEEAEQARTVVKAGELPIPVVSLDHLIAMKRAAGRAQDLADVASLEKLKRLLESSEP